MNANEIQTGAVVWAPYARSEYRFRVVDVDGERVTIKLPGSDAGTIEVAAATCFPSNATPHGVEDIR